MICSGHWMGIRNFAGRKGAASLPLGLYIRFLDIISIVLIKEKLPGRCGSRVVRGGVFGKISSLNRFLTCRIAWITN